MQQQGLIEAIRQRVIEDHIPYAGWSAGSNMACPTIGTTNDMPIIQPESFRAIGLIPFQINPHYLDAHPEGHAGETREQRIAEYIVLYPNVYVAAMRIFHYGEEAREVTAGDDLQFLLTKPQSK